LYAAFVTGIVPYIKAFFIAISENADIFYERFRIKINNLKTVSEEKYNLLFNQLTDLKKKLDDTVKENQNSSTEAQTHKKSNEELVTRNNQLNQENESNKIAYDRVIVNLTLHEPAMSSVFRGIWKFEYKFAPNTENLTGGVEYFKILNGCECHISDSPEGIYTFRCFIDRYQYSKESLNYNGSLVSVIKFEKTYLDLNEHASCNYHKTVNDGLIIGEEIYTRDNHVTHHAVSITASKISD
jgi:hypothetical protein